MHRFDGRLPRFKLNCVFENGAGIVPSPNLAAFDFDAIEIVYDAVLDILSAKHATGRKVRFAGKERHLFFA